MASVEVASQATNVKRKRRRKRMDEVEIDWIPEDTGAPYEADECFNDVPAHTIDKICKAKFGHTNWARMGQMTPTDSYLDRTQSVRQADIQVFTTRRVLERFSRHTISR